MGDSYSAGEGVEPYFANSDVGAHTKPYDNACHRSDGNSYPIRVFNDLRAASGGATTYQMPVCSGATTESMYQADSIGGTKNGEVPQVNQGWLDENTTHVSFSITGNDIEFSDVLTRCVLGPDPCSQAIADGMALLGNARAGLDVVLDTVKEEAPNAKIVVVGYPYIIIPGNENGAGLCELVISDAEMDELRAAQDVLIQMIIDEVAEAGNRVRFVDGRPLFDDHEACSSDEWVNGIINWSESGSGRSEPGSGSFHPKAQGHLAYATAIRGAFTAPWPK
jgi:hypothetical protein